jgi:hypothetical protein
MKTVKQTMLVVLGLLFFALQGCSHDDYIPVPGEPGADGTNGVSGTASCESCHSVEHKTPIINAYNLSTHNLGIKNADGSYSKHIYGTNTTYADGSLNSNRAFCSECHSQEGYIDVKKYGKPNPRGYDNFKSINCEGCHGVTHRSLNFAKDGNDFGLRNIAAVPQKINPAFTLNASPTTGGVSSANTCIGCHQARPDSNGYYKRPVFEMNEKDASGNVVITGSGSTQFYRFWSERKLANAVGPYPAGTTIYKNYSNTGTGVHASEQGDLWMGINGIDIEGTTTRLPASKTSKHFTSSSCVQCHMDKPKPGTVDTGSHTMKLSFQTCVTCHPAPEALLTTFHAKFDTEIAKLVAAFAAKPTYFKVSGTSVSIIAYDSANANTPFPTTPASGTITPTVWYQSRTDFPLKYVQAYWNFKLVTGDEGKGVHNPPYTMALIQNSIEALK